MPAPGPSSTASTPQARVGPVSTASNSTLPPQAWAVRLALPVTTTERPSSPSATTVLACSPERSSRADGAGTEPSSAGTVPSSAPSSVAMLASMVPSTAGSRTVTSQSLSVLLPSRSAAGARVSSVASGAPERSLARVCAERNGLIASTFRARSGNGHGDGSSPRPSASSRPPVNGSGASSRTSRSERARSRIASCRAPARGSRTMPVIASTAVAAGAASIVPPLLSSSTRAVSQELSRVRLRLPTTTRWKQAPSCARR